MRPNPILRELGFSEKDRVVIIHADDVGMCQAGVAALDGLADSGIVSSAATMVVCPWFPAAAAFYRAHPAMDMGLHFTVTCEWDVYRWGPISTREMTSGLLDAEGFFPRESEPVQRSANKAAIKAELEAQIRRAKSAGIDLTHVDSHMATMFHPAFLETYFATAAEARLPALWIRANEQEAKETLGLDDRTAADLIHLTDQLEARGVPLFDQFYMMPLDNPDDRIAVAQRMLGGVPPGLTYFILHPACDTPELRAIAPDWKCRVADYEAFTSHALRSFIQQSGIQVIGWRPLRDLLRKKTETS